MFHRLSTIQKLILLLFAVGLIVALLNYRTVADTIVGLQVVNRGVDLKDGLIGHWTFDPLDMTPTTAIDRGSQGNDGTFSGFDSVTTDDGVLAKALLFDGENDCVFAPTDLSSTNTITLGMWMKRDVFANDDKLALEFSSNYNTNNAGGFIVNPNTSSFGGGVFAVGHSRNGQGKTHSETFTRPSAGVWNHYAIVFDKSTNPDSINVWVNGVAQSMTTQQSINSTDNFGNDTLYLMSRSCGSLFGGDALDDVRIYNRALSEKEIQELYDIGNEGRRVSQSTTLSGGPDLERGLVGHWTFDGPDMTSNVADRSGQGNHGNLFGQTSTTTVRGVLGQALSFDGGDDYIEISDSSSLDQPSSFTVATWVNARSLKITDVTQWDSIVTKGRDGEAVADNHNFALAYNGHSGFGTVNRWVFLIENSSGSNCNLVGNAAASLNTWYYVVGVFDDGNNIIRIYVDGIQQNSVGCSLAVNTNDLPVRLGDDQSSPGTPFDGTLDDVRIYNRALSADEISRLYDLGKTTHINKTLETGLALDSGLVGHWTFDGPDMTSNVADRSGQANHGNLVGQTSTTTVRGVLGQALSFDGSDDYVQTPLVTQFNDFTVCAWFKDDGVADNFERIVDKYYIGGFWLGRSSTNTNTWGGGVREDTVPFGRFVTLSDGVWHHICSLRKDTTHTIIGDGGAVSTSGTVTSNALDGSDIVIGWNTTGEATGHMSGTIDDVRIYNRALSADEVQRLYELGR